MTEQKYMNICNSKYSYTIASFTWYKCGFWSNKQSSK